jgi:hypothetical protein
VAEIAIVDVPEVRSRGFMRQVEEDNLIYRAAYIRTAAGRLAGAQAATQLEEAAVLEAHYFNLHNAQELRRAVGGQQVAEAIELYGDTLGWYAQIRPTSRPNHRLAHEQNFQPWLGPPVLTGAYPGVLLHCLCEVGPPISGAQEIR